MTCQLGLLTCKRGDRNQIRRYLYGLVICYRGGNLEMTSRERHASDRLLSQAQEQDISMPVDFWIETRDVVGVVQETLVVKDDRI